MENIKESQEYKMLESIIENLVRGVISSKNRLNESSSDDDKLGSDKEHGENDYKRKYKAVQKALSDPKIDATQVMSKALGFDPDDDVARSHAFKKLHKKRTPDGKNVYQFSPDDIGKIFTQIP